MQKMKNPNPIRGVISCKELIAVTEDELLKALSRYGVQKVKRIKRRIEDMQVNTPTVILTFDGSELPTQMECDNNIVHPKKFIKKPTVCFKCLQIGHTNTACTSVNKICYNCSGNMHVPSGAKCSNQKFCSRCQSAGHSLADKKCPEYTMQQNLLNLPIDNNSCSPRNKLDIIYDLCTTKFKALSEQIDTILNYLQTPKEKAENSVKSEQNQEKSREEDNQDPILNEHPKKKIERQKKKQKRPTKPSLVVIDIEENASRDVDSSSDENEEKPKTAKGKPTSSNISDNDQEPEPIVPPKQPPRKKKKKPKNKQKYTDEEDKAEKQDSPREEYKQQDSHPEEAHNRNFSNYYYTLHEEDDIETLYEEDNTEVLYEEDYIEALENTNEVRINQNSGTNYLHSLGDPSDKKSTNYVEQEAPLQDSPDSYIDDEDKYARKKLSYKIEELTKQLEECDFEIKTMTFILRFNEAAYKYNEKFCPLEDSQLALTELLESRKKLAETKEQRKRLENMREAEEQKVKEMEWKTTYRSKPQKRYPSEV